MTPIDNLLTAHTALSSRIAELEAEVARLTALLIEQGHGDGCDSNRPFCRTCGKDQDRHSGTGMFCNSRYSELARFNSPVARTCNCHLSTLPAIKDKNTGGCCEGIR